MAADNTIYASAFLCDRAMREGDGVLSAIRIIDLVSISVPPDGTQPFVPFLQVALVIIFKCEVKTLVTPTIRGIDPSGTQFAMHEFPQAVVGPAPGGVSLNIDLYINSVKEGVTWFEVLANGQLVQRVSLLVRHVKASIPTSTTPILTWKKDADLSA
jgi:hypothetical protein